MQTQVLLPGQLFKGHETIWRVEISEGKVDVSYDDTKSKEVAETEELIAKAQVLILGQLLEGKKQRVEAECLVVGTHDGLEALPWPRLPMEDRALEARRLLQANEQQLEPVLGTDHGVGDNASRQKPESHNASLLLQELQDFEADEDAGLLMHGDDGVGDNARRQKPDLNNASLLLNELQDFEADEDAGLQMHGDDGVGDNASRQKPDLHKQATMPETKRA